jgi:hypothetical protein
MATIRVRYSNGDEDTWEFHESMDVRGLIKILSLSTSPAVSFGVAAKAGGTADYGFVGLRMEHVASWHIDGLLDPGQAAALWAELQQP